MSENKKKSSIKSVIQTGFPVLTTFATIYYSSFIFVTSVIAYVGTNILNISGSSVWVLQSNSDFFLIEHLANLFKIATAVPKNISNIVIMITLWALLIITTAFIEAGFFGYILKTSEHEKTTFYDSTLNYWKKSLKFLIFFTPFFIFAGLVGFFTEFLFMKIELMATLSKIISFVLMTCILVPFIPSRFYFYDGKGFGESLLLSLENLKHFALLIFPPIIISGIVVLLISNHLLSDASSVLTIISYSPFIVIIGILSWLFYGFAVSKAGEKYTYLKKLNLPQGGNFD